MHRPSKLSFFEALSVFSFLCLLYGIVLWQGAQIRPFDRYDAYWQQQVAVSLARDGDLDLRNQLQHRPKWAWDQTARGVRGEWYPVHEYLMPLLSVPFFWLFGAKGFLIFSVFMNASLGVVLYALCRRRVGPPAAFISLGLTLGATAIFPYSRSYSLDLFGALFLALSFLLVCRGHVFQAGLWCGVAILARITSVASLPAFLLYIWMSEAQKPGRASSLGRFLLGGLPALAVFFWSNSILFGEPWVTSYQRWQVFTEGELLVLNQLHSGFTRPLSDGLYYFFFSEWVGILWTLPTLPLVLLGMILLWRVARGEAMFLAVLALGLFALTVKYIGVPGIFYDPAFYGNRYLLPVVALSALPLSLLLERLQTNLLTRPVITKES